MLQVAYQSVKAGGWFEAEFGTEECAVAREGPECLGLVAFGQVHADEGGVGAFAQRFRAHGSDGSRRCVAEAPGNDEVPGKRFEGVEPELPPFFGFDDSPVVVPVGEEVGGEAGNRRLVQVGRLQLRALQEEAVRGRPGVFEVDLDTVGETDAGKRRDVAWRTGLARGKCRTRLACARRRSVGPEGLGPGCVRAALAKGEKRSNRCEVRLLAQKAWPSGGWKPPRSPTESLPPRCVPAVHLCFALWPSHHCTILRPVGRAPRDDPAGMGVGAGHLGPLFATY